MPNTSRRNKPLSSNEFRKLMSAKMEVAATMIADLHEMGHSAVELHSNSFADGSKPLLYLHISIENGISTERLLSLTDYGREHSIQITDRTGQHCRVMIWVP